jgi:WD40 repeat protein
LAAAAQGQVGQNRELALLIATEAFDSSIRGGAEPTTEAVSAMAQAIQDWRLVARFPAAPLLYPTVSPDGSLVAVGSKTSPSDVDIFGVDGSLVGTLPGPEVPNVVAWKADFSPDGEQITVTYADPQIVETFQSIPEGIPDVRTFDLATRSIILELDTDHGWAYVSHSPDGGLLAMSFDREVLVVDADHGSEVSRFEAPALAGQPEFLDDDAVLVPIEGSGFTILSARDGSVVDHLEVADLNPAITAVNDLRTHVAYRAGEQVRVTEIATGATIFDQTAPSVQALALDPAATRLAHSGYDPNIYIHNLGDGAMELELTGIQENVFSLSFVGEKQLLSYGEDALLWDVSPEGVTELRGIPTNELQWGFQVSPDERWLAYNVSQNLGLPVDPVDGLRLIDLATGEETVISQGEANSVAAGFRVVSADFTMVGSLTQEGASTMRGLPAWDVKQEFDDCRGPLAVSPDNTRVVLTGWSCVTPGVPDDAYSAVFDLRSGEEIFALPYQTLWSAEFNPSAI